LFRRLGYDPENFDRENAEEAWKIRDIGLYALIEGVDARGEPLSPENMNLLTLILGTR